MNEATKTRAQQQTEEKKTARGNEIKIVPFNCESRDVCLCLATIPHYFEENKLAKRLIVDNLQHFFMPIVDWLHLFIVLHLCPTKIITLSISNPNDERAEWRKETETRIEFSKSSKMFSLQKKLDFQLSWFVDVSEWVLIFKQTLNNDVFRMFFEFNIFKRIHCNLISNKENEMIPTIYNKISIVLTFHSTQSSFI